MTGTWVGSMTMWYSPRNLPIPWKQSGYIAMRSSLLAIGFCDSVCVTPGFVVTLQCTVMSLSSLDVVHGRLCQLCRIRLLLNVPYTCTVFSMCHTVS